MNRNLLKFTALFLLPWALSLSAAPSMADPGQRSGYMQERGDLRPNRAAFAERHAQIMSQLGLTPEQQAQFKALREQGKSQGQDLRQQLHSRRQGLMEYLKSPDATETRALQMQSEMNTLQSQMSTQRIHTWFQMRKILTPEQLQKLNQLKRPGRPAEGNSPE
jgi:Spy/CpxP family protein refolding chaperone